MYMEHTRRSFVGECDVVVVVVVLLVVVTIVLTLFLYLLLFVGGGGGVVERGEVQGNHLEFLNEENLPKEDDLFSEFEIGSDAFTSVSSFDDDSLGTMEPAALLNELQHLAKEQNIDVSNLSYDSIVNGFQRVHLWSCVSCSCV